MSSPDDPTRAVPSAAVVAGRYRLDALVGRGGTAEVWRATDTQLDRAVALKLVTVAHDESSARAADEARTLAQLSHPHLVQVYDAGTDNAGRPWVVMEYVDGETLADAIRRGPLTAAEVGPIGLAVAEALEHVHGTGLVHRDIKPANVLMGKGKTKLTDFGIARLVDAAKVTSTGLMVGTAAYLAPEQVSGRPVGPATDVYALGLVLLEALTAHREYDGPAVEAAMARLSRPPVIPPTLPAGWPALLTAMTTTEAAERPTAGEVARLLRAVVHGQPTTVLPRTAATRAPADPTRALPRTTVTPAPVAAAPRTGRNAAIAAAVGVLLAGGIAAGVLSQQDKGEPQPIPPVTADVPDQLRQDLQEFVKQVPQ